MTYTWTTERHWGAVRRFSVQRLHADGKRIGHVSGSLSRWWAWWSDAPTNQPADLGVFTTWQQARAALLKQVQSTP